MRKISRVAATKHGFKLISRGARKVAILAPPIDESNAQILAFLADGEAWSSGVTFDGQHVWFATGDKINALDPETGEIVRSIDVAAHAGIAFDGTHLFQISEDHIQKIDLESGRVIATIPAPGHGGDSGLAWAEGSLWVGQSRGRKIQQINPETGDIIRMIESKRIVTGVTWTNRELWYGTWEDNKSDIRRIDPETGTVREEIKMPAGTGVSGLEAGTAGHFFCGGGGSGKIRTIARPKAI